MFHLSLSSKELFHSNLLAWLAEDPDTRDLFVEVLKLFGLEDSQAKKLADGIRGNEYMVLREYKNFDFCICEKLKNWKEDSEEEYVPGRVVLVLENKFKSIPYEAQLKGYRKKVGDLNEEGMKNNAKSLYYEKNKDEMPKKWSKKLGSQYQIQDVTCHFVLLTLDKEVCGLKLEKDDVSGKDKFGIWHVVSYKEYAQKLSGHAEDKPDLKHQIIKDYAGYVDKFCKCIDTKLQDLKLKKKWKEVLCPDPDLRAIRMDDIWQKLVANIVLKQLRLKAKDPLIGNENTGQVLVGAGFSRGTALIEIKIHIGDGCLFGVQIQNGLYKRFLEASKGKVETDKNSRITFYEDRLKEIKDLNLFRYNNNTLQWDSNWEDAVDNVLTGNVSPKGGNTGKAGLQGFGGYGTTFLAQWKAITEGATVEKVIEHIIKDCSKVKNKLNL